MYEIIEYIYRLVDPRNKQVRYVGRTYSPFERLKTHVSGKNPPEKFAWISELKALDMIPTMEIIEAIIFDPNTPIEQSTGPREAYWIQFYKNQGAKLFNKPHRTAQV